MQHDQIRESRASQLTDYCTGWLDRLLWWDWSMCCRVHDDDYALGIVKDLADGFLAICVNHVLPGMGDVMWVGLVFIFGWASRWFYAKAAAQRKASATQ